MKPKAAGHVDVDAEGIAGIVIADATTPGLPMVYVSPGFERLTGYGSEEVLGRSCSLLQGAETDPRAREVLRHAIAQGREGFVTLLNYRKDGTTFFNEVSLAPQHDVDGRVVQYIGVQKDVTEQVSARRHMHELAYHDPLTGLANRTVFTDELSQSLLAAQEHERELSLVFIDIDDFKEINDTHGHAAGDEALRVVAARLKAIVRPNDVLARAGGDEFLLLVRGDRPGRDAVRGIASRIADALRDPVGLGNGHLVEVRASTGVSTYPHDATEAGELLAHADAAMYAAKDRGKNRTHFYAGALRKTGYRSDPSFQPRDAVAELARILDAGDITAVYQPIVALQDETAIGYEALARGPEGSILQRPDRLFATAAVAERTVELDWLCRIRAVEGALAAGLGPSAALFINCEPTAIDAPCPAEHEQVWARAQRELALILEITERAVTDRPAQLSRLVHEHQEAGLGVALDDLGADVRSLALLPFIEPDIIKLDLRLVQERPSIEQTAIVSAVAAESERTGAAIVAEGVETEEHVAVARSLGAHLGQGYRWGRPGPLPRVETPPWRRPTALHSGRGGHTPFEVIAPHTSTIQTKKSLLLPMSHHLENHARRIGEGAVLLAAFQDARHFTPHTAVRYATLARASSLVAALGVGLHAEPAEGVRGATIDAHDPLTGEWSVLVVGPHFAAALVAQDLGDDHVEAERRFVAATTYRRDLVIAAARSLLERLDPVTTAPHRLSPS